MSELTALWREDATEEETVEAYQAIVNSGDAWRLEGHVGRTVMALIEAGEIALGHDGHRDYWGNYVPSRSEVVPGSKGSAEFVRKRSGGEPA